MEFTISKKVWLRNETKEQKKNPNYDYDGGQLLNSHKKMCCLGIISNQLGIPKKDLLGRASPSDLCSFNLPNKNRRKYSNKINILVELESKTDRVEDNQLSNKAIEINDDHTTSDKKKIQLLTQLFKEHGHKLVFTD